MTHFTILEDVINKGDITLDRIYNLDKIQGKATRDAPERVKQKHTAHCAY